MTKITKLIAENFKRLTAVTISPDGSTVVVGGRNEQGKTSTLDAIEAALGGGKRLPSEPIQRGKKKARIVVETDDLVVTRTFTPKGSELEVKAKDGSRYPSPQALLDGLVGPISFDPLAFTRKDPKEQAEVLRKLVGLDFTKEDVKRKEAFDKRTNIGREIKRLQGALDSLPDVPNDVPDTEVSVAELAHKIEAERAHNRANEEKRQQLGELRQEAIAAGDEVKDLEVKLEAAKAKLSELNARGPALRKEVDMLIDANIDAVTEQMATAETTNKAVRAKIERTKLEGEHNKAVDESETLTRYINEVDEYKASAIAGAKYPIAGLTLTDEGLQLNGIPFAQASSAQKIKVSVAIGLALNPQLKVLLMRDGSLLDNASLATVAQMATEAEAQVWIEKVSDTGEGCTLVIEDGEVAETRPEAEASS